MSNYTIFHLHSHLSNATTVADSVTKPNEYIDKAKECGMKALAFSEHGNIMKWWSKKRDIEAAGMKYMHAVEAYVTYSLEEKVRDNYHCVLIAKNYDGFLELNRLVSKSFDRSDGHFYYNPRITLNELYNTSDNIIVTTACIGGVIGKTLSTIDKCNINVDNFERRINQLEFAKDDNHEPEIRDLKDELKKEYDKIEKSDEVLLGFLNFLRDNKDRCFVEVGHHNVQSQIEYNKSVFNMVYGDAGIGNNGMLKGVKLIAGTDTHCLDERSEMGRDILQKAKSTRFENEEGWDLTFKTYDELVSAFKNQGSLPEEVYMEAINNTNLLVDIVEDFTIDKSTKYPKIYKNPEEAFLEKINTALNNHPYALKNHSKDEVDRVIKEEFEVYKSTDTIDFMLMQTYLREWEHDNNIFCGPGRGSVSGSMIAYLLGVTNMDSMKFGLNFFRFLNPERVTNADIDTDYSSDDRDKVKEFLLRDNMGIDTINSAEIIIFNTIELKGAIRDVCRALYKDSPNVKYLKITSEVLDAAESNEDSAREKYQEIFKYVDAIVGTIVSVGTHASGVLISDLPIHETIGLCSISSSPYPVSMIDMKELDDLFYVKLDILGLSNIGVINDACDIAGIERVTPDNIDLNDENVWMSIRDDTTLIFQWESPSAQQYIRKFMSDKTLEIAKANIPNFSMMKWLSFGNGLLRPACASFRDSVAKGEFYDNGFDELNTFLSPEAGRIAMQETIMQFLVKFCGYNGAESDLVRRSIAKKKGTETLLPEIERRFIEYSKEHYDITEEKCQEVIKPFLQVILDASDYSFSWN